LIYLWSKSKKGPTSAEEDVVKARAALATTIVLFALVTLALLWPERSGALWWLAAGFALMVAALVVTLAVEVPIDNQIQDWTAATLPGDWRSIQARWELFHTIRTFLSIAAVVAVTVSSTVAGRPLDQARRVDSVRDTTAAAS
jgi:uncharacterized membrane protein